MQPKIYTNEELTKIVDELRLRIRSIELKHEKEWSEKVAKNARKWY